MTRALDNTAAAHWKRYWPLPVSTALAYAVSALHLYSMGPMVVPLAPQFG
jgi:hypothetical protein